MKKFLMLSVLLALFAGSTSYAQVTWPIDITGGNLTVDLSSTHHYPSENLIDQVLNPVFSYRGSADYWGPAGVYVEAGDYTAPSTPGVYLSYCSVLVAAAGIDPADNISDFSDDIVNNGVVDVYLGSTFDWNLYSDLYIEWYAEYTDGSTDYYVEEWN